MNTNDNCTLAIFKWLATILSFVIALPGYFDNNSKIAFILTVCVFVFGKFIENLDGIIRYKTLFHVTFCIIGSFLAALAIGFCFYYFAAIFNVTQIIEVPEASIENEREIIIELSKEYDYTVKLFSNADMSKYPLFKGDFFYVVLFLVLVYFIIQETTFCGCEFCKYFNTKRKVVLNKKIGNNLLNISAK